MKVFSECNISKLSGCHRTRTLNHLLFGQTGQSGCVLFHKLGGCGFKSHCSQIDVSGTFKVSNMIGNKETFVNQIIGQAIPDGHQITSFDTENLFTNANLNVNSQSLQNFKLMGSLELVVGFQFFAEKN